MVHQRVGSRRDRDCFLREREGLVVPSGAGVDLGLDTPPRDATLQVVAREPPCLGREARRLVVRTRVVRRARQQRGGPRRVGVEAERPQAVVGDAQMSSCRVEVATHELDDPREQVGLEQAVREAELLERAARRRDEPARGVGAPPERLEHALAALRGRLDGRRSDRDAQQPHDVEAATTRAGNGVRAPHLRGRRGGQRRGREPAVTRFACAGQREIECCLDVGEAAEPGEHRRVHRVGLGRAARVVQPFELHRDRRDALLRVAQPARVGHGRQLRRETFAPGREARRRARQPGELGDRVGRRGRFPHREERVAAHNEDVRPDRVVERQAPQRARRECRRRGKVLAIERPVGSREEVGGGFTTDVAPVGVECPELPPLPERLLEVVADELAVLRDDATELVLQPAREMLV